MTTGTESDIKWYYLVKYRDTIHAVQGTHMRALCGLSAARKNGPVAPNYGDQCKRCSKILEILSTEG